MYIDKPTKELLTATVKAILVVGERRDGKTRAGAEWAVSKLIQTGKPGIIISANSSMLHETAVPMFIERLEFMVPHGKYVINKKPDFPHKPELASYHQTLVVSYPGAVTFLRSAASEPSLRGMAPSWIWFDEPLETKPDTWAVLKAMGAQTCISATPQDCPRWVFTEFLDNYMGVKPDHKIIPLGAHY